MVQFLHMDSIHTPALVLHAQVFAESDKKLVLLTLHAGKRSVIAKGAMRPTSKFGARTLPPSHIEVSLAPGRNLDILTQCESIHLFPALHKNINKMTMGLRIVQFVYHALPAGGHFPEIYKLLLEFLYALEKSHSPTVLAAAFMAKFLDVEGIFPQLDRCARCKRQMQTTPKKVAFGNALGGILCRACALQEPDTTVLSFTCLEDLHRWKNQEFPEITTSHNTPQSALLFPILHAYANNALG